MSDSIDLFGPEAFIPNDLRHLKIAFKPWKSRRNNEKGVSVFQIANKRVATESVDYTSANKLLRLSNEYNISHRLSKRLDDGKRPSRVSLRLADGLPTDKQSFSNLKERLEIQKTETWILTLTTLSLLKSSYMVSVGIITNGIFPEVLETSRFSRKSWTALSAFPQTLAQILLWIYLKIWTNGV